MSLTWTTVRCNDGRWYRNPVWRGFHEGMRFFLCFDDDDPPELIVEKDKNYTQVDAILKARIILDDVLKIRADINAKSFDSLALRLFTKSVKDGFKPSFRFFLEILDPPPPPNDYDVVSTEPPNTGVLFPYGAMV